MLPDLSLTSLFEGGPEVTPQALAEAATLAVTTATPGCTVHLAVGRDATPCDHCHGVPDGPGAQ